MDEDSRITIEYLQGLPDGAAVRWSTYHLSADRLWTNRWVDIRIEAEDAPPMGWVWTIIGDDDPDGIASGQAWQFIWPYDLDVHEVWEPPHPPAVIGREMGAWAVPRGEPVPQEVVAALREDAGRGHVVLGGWSVSTIGEALAGWAAEHAGRPDLRFEWAPGAELPPAVAQAARRAQEIEQGGAVWDLGDGITVADGLMDELLAMDPDDRASLMEVFREATGRALGDRGEPTSDD